MKILIEAGFIRPGEQFTHYGSKYQRATMEETPTHIARHLPDTILAYWVRNEQRMPVSFRRHVTVLIQGRGRA